MLSSTVQNQIAKDFDSLMTALNDSIANLDIGIAFLVSVGGDPDKTLADFMHKTLSLKPGIHSRRVSQSVHFLITKSINA